MERTIRILIAEHDQNDLELILYEMNKGIRYVSEIVQNETEFTSALERFVPDIILSDYSFPAFDGPAAFAIRQAMVPGTPFIFVSGAIGEEKSVELIKQGLTDYVLKDKLFTLNFKVIRALNESSEKKLKAKAEQDLGVSEARLARAQQVARIGHWELNVGDKVIRCSDEACRIHGFPPGQNLHALETWLSMIITKEGDFPCNLMKTASDYPHNLSFRYSLQLANGLMTYISLETKPEYDAAGKFLGLYGTAQDITEMVMLENKLVNERLSRNGEIMNAVLTAQESERAQIGKELHENLNQILGAAKLYIELAKHDTKVRSDLLQKASDSIFSVIDKIRKISKTLGSPGEQRGLFNSIRVLIADRMTAHQIHIRFRETNILEKELSQGLKLTIFRIVQEQVSNILKHSGAEKAVIKLARHGNDVILLITDNGFGSDQLMKTHGVGIQNIRSRSDLYDGTVVIVSKPGKGYSLKVSMSMTRYMNKPAFMRAEPAY